MQRVVKAFGIAFVVTLNVVMAFFVLRLVFAAVRAGAWPHWFVIVLLFIATLTTLSWSPAFRRFIAPVTVPLGMAFGLIVTFVFATLWPFAVVRGILIGDMLVLEKRRVGADSLHVYWAESPGEFILQTVLQLAVAAFLICMFLTMLRVAIYKTFGPNRFTEEFLRPFVFEIPKLPFVDLDKQQPPGAA